MQVKFVIRKEVGAEGRTLWVKREPNLVRTLWPTGRACDATLFDSMAEAQAAAAEYQQRFFVGGYRVTARLPARRSDWQCPIGHEGCTRNCGNYGCGN